MRTFLHVFLSLLLLPIAYPTSAYNHSMEEFCEDLCLENNNYLIADPLVVSLVCPATPGYSGLESATTTTIVVAATATDDTGSGSITFPSGIYSAIPTNAIDINVSLTTELEAFGNSWLEEIFISIDAPGTFADDGNYHPSSTNGGGTESYTIDYGNNNPTGLWNFIVEEDLNDQGIDSEVTFTISISWTVPPIPSDCDTIICDANSFVLDTDLPGLSYNWSTIETTQSITVTQSGTYTVTVTDGTEIAIDDITVIFGASEETVDVNLCDGDTHTIGSNTYTMSGIFTDVFESYTGCDSTIITNLTIGELGTTEIYPIICNGGSHTIGTNTYTSSGDFTDVIMSSQGCDSTIITHLTVLDLIETTVDTTICFDENYTVGTSNYTMSGNFTNVLTSYQNCDSTVHTNLIILDEYEESQDITICFGESHIVGTNTYTSDGNYTDLLVSSTGCDSTILTNLTILEEIIEENTITLCFGETHTVGTVNYDTSGDYTDILVSSEGCDSTVITHLTVLAENSTEEFIQICGGQSYEIGSNSYDMAGDYINILISAAGCDSTVLTHLAVVLVITAELDVTICEGETYVVGTNTYDISGDFIDTLISVSGCDSIIITHLAVVPIEEENNVHILCFGDTLFVGNSAYTTSGSYTDNLVTFAGCDSIIHSDLTILGEIIGENTITLCFNESITIGSNTYDISGDYTDILVSSNGCDSTIITHLTVFGEIVSPINAQICLGQTYMEGSNTYDMSGTYTDVYQSIDGCDSTVITSLTVVDQIETILDIIICPGDSYAVGTSTYNTDGTYMDTLLSSGGCDSIVTTNLSVYIDIPSNQVISICFGESYSIGTSTYSNSGTYTDIIPSSIGCDSTIITVLTIIGSGSYANSVQICAGDTYIIGTSTYTNAGIYTDVLTSSLNCDSTVITTLDVVSVINTEETVLLCEGDSYQGIVYETSTTLVNEEQSISGCDSIHSISLIVSEGLEIDLIVQDDICAVNQGSIMATVFGGIPPYSYAWNPNINSGALLEGLSAGLYEVTVTDSNGCTITASAVINTSPRVTIVADVTNMSCNGDLNGAIDITVATGTAPYLFIWSGPNNFSADTEDIDNLIPGSYTIIIYDANGCGFGSTIHVTEPDPLIVDLITYSGTVVASVTGGTAPYQYFWNNGSTTPSLVDVSAGNYYVTIEDSNGCFTSGEAVLFNTNVVELENFIGLNILPNPSAGRFIIDLEMSVSTNLNFSIYNLDGKSIYQNALDGMNIREEIDLTNHSSGTYLLVIDDGRNRKVKKIVIAR